MTIIKEGLEVAHYKPDLTAPLGDGFRVFRDSRHHMVRIEIHLDGVALGAVEMTDEQFIGSAQAAKQARMAS